jgi:hypothetical protein
MIQDVRIPVESLVFTDEQYWRAVGNPTGFASRIFAQALDGVCVFIGLSMTDINIIRWLAQYAMEAHRDFRLMTSAWVDQDKVEFDAVEELSRHYWIVERDFNDPSRKNPINFGTRVLRDVLQLRGVDRIEIPSWQSKEFHTWWSKCFLS